MQPCDFTEPQTGHASNAPWMALWAWKKVDHGTMFNEVALSSYGLALHGDRGDAPTPGSCQAAWRCCALMEISVAYGPVVLVKDQHLLAQVGVEPLRGFAGAGGRRMRRTSLTAHDGTERRIGESGDAGAVGRRPFLPAVFSGRWRRLAASPAPAALGGKGGTATGRQGGQADLHVALALDHLLPPRISTRVRRGRLPTAAQLGARLGLTAVSGRISQTAGASLVDDDAVPLRVCSISRCP